MANAATEGRGVPPEGFPQKYSYKLHLGTIPVATLPGVGDSVIPNKMFRTDIIKTSHEGLVYAHAGSAATV